MRYTYQLYGDGEIYSSRIKAHRRLCNTLKKNEDDFIPYREKLSDRCRAWVEIIYPNGHNIVKRPIL